MFRAKYVPYLFLFPAVALLIVFKLYPILIGMMNSLYAPTFIAGERSFTGLENYVSLFHDPVFWKSVYVTLFFNVFVNPLQVALAFLLALLLQVSLKGKNVFRSIHFIPVAVSLPIACIVWNIMLSPEQGIVNSLLMAIGLPEQPFLGDKHQAIWAIIGIATWKGVGYWAIFLLAGLQEVPGSLYEAAEIDGAGKLQRFWNITVPLMKRPLSFVVVSDTIANFLLFAPMYLLTKGGPERSTDVLMQESFNSAFTYSDPGRASAILVMLLFIVSVIILVQFRLLRSNA